MELDWLRTFLAVLDRGGFAAAAGAAFGLDEGRLTLLTTPCLGAAFLPALLSRPAAAHPGVRFEVLEDGRHDVERRFLDEGVVMAVLPTLAAPAAPGLRTRLLWREPVCAVVPADHRFARLGVGLLTAVAAGGVAGDGTVTVPLTDPGLTRPVSAYWYEVLLATDLGRALHREVLAAPVPAGATPAEAAFVPAVCQACAAAWSPS